MTTCTASRLTLLPEPKESVPLKRVSVNTQPEPLCVRATTSPRPILSPDSDSLVKVEIARNGPLGAYLS